MILLEVLEKVLHRTNLNFGVLELGSANNISTFRLRPLPRLETNTAFMLHFLDPAKFLIVAVFLVEIPEELLTHIGNITASHVLLAHGYLDGATLDIEYKPLEFIEVRKAK